MVEINLLPEELKLKAKKSNFSLEIKDMLCFALAALALLVIMHFCLAAVLIAKSYQLNTLNKQWRVLEPQRKALEAAKKEFDVLSEGSRIAERLLKQRINLAQKLNCLSIDLPSGVWLDELSLTAKGLILKCSAISLKKEEMVLVNKFIDSLKNDPRFFGDFTGLELSSVQVRTIGGYDVVDFILTAALKSRQGNS